MRFLTIMAFLCFFARGTASCFIVLSGKPSEASLVGVSKKRSFPLQFQKSLQSFFSYQSEAPYLATGVLVEMSDGERVFIMGDYFGANPSNLVSSVKGIGASSDSYVKKIIWNGDLQFKASSGELFLNAVIANSGKDQSFFQSTKPGFFKDNSGASVEVASSPDAFIRFIDEIGSRPNQEGTHNFLDVELRQGDTFANQFNNRLGAIAGNLSVILNKRPLKALTLEEKLEIFSDLNSDLKAEATRNVLAQMRRVYSKRSPSLMRALDRLTKFQQQLELFEKNREKKRPISAAETRLMNDTAYLEKAQKAVFDVAKALMGTGQADAGPPHVIIVRSSATD